MDQASITAIHVRVLGFDILPKVLTLGEVHELIETLGDSNGPGKRGLLDIPVVAALATSSRLVDLVRPCVPGTPRPVRALYFDKSPDTNWSVSWHQDVTLAVKARAEVEGFGPWSLKDGVPHVHAPAKLLERMLTIRLHLDDCDETNGTLHVLIGSHQFGRATPAEIEHLRQECPEYICRVPAGGAMCMRPLLLHCSKRSESDRHRRVLHIEYAGFDLPPPLDWQ